MAAASNRSDPRQTELPVDEPPSGWRAMTMITDSWLFQNFILFCILANAVALGVDAHLGDDHWIHPYIENLDRYFLAIFTAELVMEFFAAGPRRYFRNGWNVFDLFVVSLSYVATMPFISALRTLRVLRVLRLVSAVPQMRRVVEALFGAMPGILATFAVLTVVFYIGAVMATTLFGETHEQFKDLAASALTLFQLTQFDGWGDMVNDLNKTYPWAWSFILAFTVIAAFAVLNLFIGVIVEAVQDTSNTTTLDIKKEVDVIERDVEEIEESVDDIAQAQDKTALDLQAILQELRALRTEVAALKSSGGPRF
ncbi:MAG: ion transporter [Caulobacterales bacterium]